MYENAGVISMGVKCPIIRKGDDIVKIVVDSVLSTTTLSEKDVIGITESVVARAAGNYVTVDEIVADIKRLIGDADEVVLINPIYSRNRFSVILRAFARAVNTVFMIMPDKDEVGNPCDVNQFTGVDIKSYYNEICMKEGAAFVPIQNINIAPSSAIAFYCGLHDYQKYYTMYFTLADICNHKCKFGLLGSNKATDEKLKLFPNSDYGQTVVEDIRSSIYNRTNGIKVEVMIYGDGCFKDPIGGIWEFADPVTSPAYTDGLEGTPNEIKIKAFADDQFRDLEGDDLTEAIKQEVMFKESKLVGNMKSQGTTPRRYIDLLASLMDLTSGSGDKGTPVVVVKNYFKNFAN